MYLKGKVLIMQEMAPVSFVLHIILLDLIIIDVLLCKQNFKVVGV